ncbi:MAG: VWA domain-containing protein [Gammaproteobacteria bacterium]
MVSVLALLLCAVSVSVRASQDVVVLLNTSTGMSAEKVRQLSAQMVTDFVDSRGPNTRIALIAFASTPSVLIPLTSVSTSSRKQIHDALQHREYRSQWTDTSGGLERALSEIIDHGNANSQKGIIFISDEGMNTGSRTADKDQTRWIMQSLVPAAVYNRIRLFGVAFTKPGNGGLLQELAERTGGDFFHIAQPSDLAGVLKIIDARLTSTALPIVLPEEIGSPARLLPLPTESMVPAKFNTPLTHPDNQPTHMRWLWLVALLVLIAACVGIYTAWNMRFVKTPRTLFKPAIQHAEGPRAVLYDISNPNDIKRFELAERATLLGRVAGYDPEVQYVMVKEKTVGRCHAVIERRGHSFWIMDQGSINGTFVNGERITADRALKHGDIVAIHRHEFEFMIPEYFESDATVVGAREQLAT